MLLKNRAVLIVNHQETSSGFRKGRSTAQAAFPARRAQDLAEQPGEGTAMVFLDWEKAFDKTDQGRMFLALARLNIQPQTINAINAIYANPTFRIKLRGGIP